MWRWVKFSKAGAALAFFLPWITVSCSNQTIGTASGWNLAKGTVAFTNPMNGYIEHHTVPANTFLFAAFILILVGLALSLIKGRPLPRVSVEVLGTSILALILVFVAMQRINGASVAQAISGRVNTDALSTGMIRIEYAYGFWLACAALASSAFLAWRTMTEISAMDSRTDVRPYAEEEPPPVLTKTCPACGQRASGEAYFCPVDGTALAE